MRLLARKPSAKILLGVVCSLLLVGSACQPANNANTTTANTTTNVNTTNTSNTSNANTTSLNTTGTPIETREPDQYSATISVKMEASGGQSSISTPALSADFAHNGQNQRVSVKIGNDQIIYLDRADKRYVILPNRKQYAELDPQSTGFDVPKLMTPAQVISQVKSVSGCTNAGEEQFNGRNAVKYRCSAAARTGTQAGDVKDESFIYVDKDTGLPLHSESVISSSGNVGGASTVKIVTEMSNIQTSVPANMFDLPTGLSKIDANQVRTQVDTILKALLALTQNMMQSGSTTTTTPTPSVSPTPAQ
jgi:hypothetical protein